MRRVLLSGLVVLLGVVGNAAGIRAAPIGDKAAETQTIEQAPSHGKVGASTEIKPGATAPDLPSAPPGFPARSSVSGVPANPASSPAPARPAPTLTEKPVKQSSLPPIAFFVAKGESHTCGRDCAEWIGADGTFDSGAPQRLRALLNRLGKRKLPIYFHSPGGSVAAALAIGRMMRERGLTAGVAWTVPQGCDPKEPREPACDKLKRSGRDLPAQLETGRTMCNSACVYALVGAAVRDVGPGASLGIHSSSMTFVNSHTHAPTRPAPHVVRAAMVAGYERIASYLRDMGIDPALLRAAREIEHDRVRFLTRAEIRRFNIDQRPFVETNWKLVEEPARSISKYFVSKSIRRDGDDLRGLVSVVCWTSDRLRLEFTRVRAPSEEIDAATLYVSAGGTVQDLFPVRRVSSSTAEYEVRMAQVSPSFLLDAGDGIAITAASRASEVPKAADPGIKLSTDGLAPVLAKLLPLCGIAPGAVKADGPAPPKP